MHSQNNEEAIILDYFRDVPAGRFLDIGAYDGVMFSNTRALWERGWTGVLVEPAPSVLPALARNYAAAAGIRIVEAAIMPAVSGPVRFLDSGGDPIGTTVDASAARWPTAHFDPVTVAGMSVADLFDLVGHQFEFINIDVEGANREILEVLPWSDLPSLRMLCVEHDGHCVELSAWAAAHGFMPCALNRENLILCRT